jgi:hypothetical protein
MLSVLFLNIQCTYLLLPPNRVSLPGSTACMGCVKKQVTELKQKNVFCRAQEYLRMHKQDLLCMYMLQFFKNSPGWQRFNNEYITISAL